MPVAELKFLSFVKHQLRNVRRQGGMSRDDRRIQKAYFFCSLVVLLLGDVHHLVLGEAGAPGVLHVVHDVVLVVFLLVAAQMVGHRVGISPGALASRQ